MQALRDVSLDVNPGEFVGLAGPSGSGKTTLLNIAGLTDRPDQGRVLLGGEDVMFSNEPALIAARRTRLGYVFQSFNLISSMTVEENVSLPLLLNNVPIADAFRRTHELLDRVSLGHRRRHLPSELSGGEMQRAAVCRAVIHKPALILGDEPTGNLDSQSGAAVIDLLRLVAAEGAAVLMASHSEQALSVCDRTIHLKDGGVSLTSSS